MNFDLTDEQRMIRDLAREFAIKEITPRSEEMERSGEYPYGIIHALRDKETDAGWYRNT